jgi:hypothetical protein
VQLIVVGFHRSGTSLTTQLVHAGGLFVGDDLLGAMPSNPYGHFEDKEVLELHRQVMDDHGVGWQVNEPQLFTLSPEQWSRMENFVARRDAHHNNWGFKDPRVCFFLGEWKYLMPDAKFLVVFRDPAECVRSMEARHGREYQQGSGDPDQHLRFFVEADHGLRLWDVHNRAISAFVASHLDDCLVVPFGLLERGLPLIRIINRRFGSKLREVPTEAVFDPEVTQARDAALWVHQRASGSRARRTWDDLMKLSERTGGAR